MLIKIALAAVAAFVGYEIFGKKPGAKPVPLHPMLTEIMQVSDVDSVTKAGINDYSTMVNGLQPGDTVWMFAKSADSGSLYTIASTVGEVFQDPPAANVITPLGQVQIDENTAYVDSRGQGATWLSQNGFAT